MLKSRYGHSWVIIKPEKGEPEGFCSIHCAAISLALHTSRAISGITVGDFNTKKQIDAEAANWVIGGNLTGVMTARAKWAFENRESADAFISKHGGRPATFTEALRAAFDDMYSDILMIRKKCQLIQIRNKKVDDQQE
jgi:nitrous oxide reductase accessory protein NosL